MNQDDTHNQHDPDDQLRKLAGRKDVFKTPDNYFEQLSMNVSGRISGPAMRKHDIIFRPAIILYTAIIAVVMFSAAFYFANNRKDKNLQHAETTYEIPDSVLLLSINEDILAEEFSNTESGVPDEETLIMYEYLIDNNTDLTLITNEL